MARVGALALALAAASAVAHVRAARADSPPPSTSSQGDRLIELVADRDDDDVNGVPDGEETHLSVDARADVMPLEETFVGTTLTPESGGEHARLVARGEPIAWGARVPPGAGLQGVSPGLVVLDVVRADGTRASDTLTVAVAGLGFRDGAGHDVDFARSHASLDRSPPSRAAGDGASLYDEPDPLRLFIVTPYESPPAIVVESVGATGAHLDALTAPSLSPVPCGALGAALHCFASDPLRFVIDDVDRRHALAAGRSLRAELGGAIVLRRQGKKEQAIRVLGPRDTPAGPIGRLRATLRPFVVRLTPGGVPAIGGNDSGAVLAFRAEIAAADATWGQCGVSFGPPEEVAVRVVDPPPPYLLAIGDGLGLPASGGRIAVRIDGVKSVEIVTRPGELPIEAAHEMARAIEKAGFAVVMSTNARVTSGAAESVDLAVHRTTGGFARLETLEGIASASNDPTLNVRIGAVELDDGLTHFGDFDSVAGTLEERTLLKALDDGDPSTLEVIVVPFFTGGGRIGESFIGADRGSLRNVVILDRSGIRARRSSLTLAHELGHVLLDVPGHPDDFGSDTPTRLMDADASDASPFGPRRLTLAECARMIRQSGPLARAPLLRDWPVGVLRYLPPANAR